jgi:hypothetical protein
MAPRSGRGSGWRGLFLGRGFFAFEISGAAFAFQAFVKLLAHISLVCSTSVVRQKEYEELLSQVQ